MVCSRKILAIAVALPLLASGCVFYPEVTKYNDPTCNLDRHRMKLSVFESDLPSNGRGCDLNCIAGMALISGTTFTASGTLVLAGNSALWLEKEGENYYLTKRGRCGNLPATAMRPALLSSENDGAAPALADPQPQPTPQSQPTPQPQKSPDQ